MDESYETFNQEDQETQQRDPSQLLQETQLLQNEDDVDSSQVPLVAHASPGKSIQTTTGHDEPQATEVIEHTQPDSGPASREMMASQEEDPRTVLLFDQEVVTAFDDDTVVKMQESVEQNEAVATEEKGPGLLQYGNANIVQSQSVPKRAQNKQSFQKQTFHSNNQSLQEKNQNSKSSQMQMKNNQVHQHDVQANKRHTSPRATAFGNSNNVKDGQRRSVKNLTRSNMTNKNSQGTTTSDVMVNVQLDSNPGTRHQENGMGIGPGGSDLSQFFQSDKQQLSGHGTLCKPKTAENVGQAVGMVDPNEFCSMAQSKKSETKHGPNITNIGFAFSSQTHPNIVAYPSMTKGLSTPSDASRTAGSTNNHSKTFGNQNNLSNFMLSNSSTRNHPKLAKTSFNQQKYGNFNDQVMSSSHLDSHSQTRSNGQTGGFSQMKPFIQGSSLQQPRQSQKAVTPGRLQYLIGKQSTKPDYQRKTQQKKSTTEYNFFNQKLTSNGIPKNQELKYRKEMQQLKFYQTLNNYPYLVQQQKLKQDQQKQKQKQQTQHQQLQKRSAAELDGGMAHSCNAVGTMQHPQKRMAALCQENLVKDRHAAQLQQNSQKQPTMQTTVAAYGYSTNNSMFLPSFQSQQTQQFMNQQHQRGGADFTPGQSVIQSNLAGNQNLVNAETQIDESTNVRESQVTDALSSKHTVYQQMHLCQKKLNKDSVKVSKQEVSAKLTPKAAVGDHNQQKRAAAASSSTKHGAFENNDNKMMVVGSRQVEVKADQRGTGSHNSCEQKQGQLSAEQTVGESEEEKDVVLMRDTSKDCNIQDEGGSKVPINIGKPSILTQETEIQVSTHNASSIEQRVIFDQSPKLAVPSDSSQKLLNSLLKEKKSSNGKDQTIMTELGQPEINQTKKFVNLDVPSPSSRRNTCSAKPLNNTATNATAFQPSNMHISGLNDGVTNMMNEETIPFALNKLPVEQFQIKQQTASASYLAQRPPSKMPSQTVSQETVLVKSGKIETVSSAGSKLIVMGNRVESDQQTKTTKTREISRVHSMKPKVDSKPLIRTEENKDSSATEHWVIHAVSKAKEDRQLEKTVQLAQQDVVINSVGQAPGGVTDIQINEGQPPAVLTASASQKKEFDTSVDGKGLSGLFSVWGPSSQQTKQLRTGKSTRRNEIAGGSDNLPIPDITGTSATVQAIRRQSNTAEASRKTLGQGKLLPMNNRDLALDGTDPRAGVIHHMQLVNSIINDGMLQNLVFQNASLEYVQHSKNSVVKMLQNAEKQGMKTGGVDTGAKAGLFIEDIEVENEDEDEEEEDEHVIVTMLKSMNTRKLEAGQLKEMNLETNVEKLRQEIKLEYFKQIQSRMNEKIDQQWQDRLLRFDKIFNKIIAKQLALDQENAYANKLQEHVKLQEEKMKNPFYQTLKAQKEERDKFIDFYSSGLLFGLPSSAEGKLESAEALPKTQNIAAIENGDMTDEQNATDGGDLFRHTRVEIAEDELEKTNNSSNRPGHQAKKQSSSVSRLTFVSQTQFQEDGNDQTSTNFREDIFRFYSLNVELPKTFFTKLGDAQIVKQDAINLIKSFIVSEWPVLAKRRRITYRVSYDASNHLFNTIPLGKEAPLSRCCMRNVNFVFSQSILDSGKVLCTDPFCLKNTLDTFQMTEQLVFSLFSQGLRHQYGALKADKFYLDGVEDSTAFQPSTTEAIFMSNRRRMQQGGGHVDGVGRLQQRLGRRYLSAASQEISKQVGAGHHRHCRLEKVITNTKFQQEHLPDNRMPCESRELMDMILNMQPRRQSQNQWNQTSQNVYSDGGGIRSSQSISMNQTKSDIYNENQMLAEIIQKQALEKSKHKASLTIGKLMRTVNSKNRAGMRNNQRQYYNTASSAMQQRRKQPNSQMMSDQKEDSIGFPQHSNNQYLSQQSFRTGSQAVPAQRQTNTANCDLQGDESMKHYIQVPPYQEHQPSVGSNQYLATQHLNSSQQGTSSPERNLSAMIDRHFMQQQYNQDGQAVASPSAMPHAGDVQESGTVHENKTKTMTQVEEESATNGQTMMTAGVLDEAKYSHSKSPVQVTSKLSKCKFDARISSAGDLQAQQQTFQPHSLQQEFC